MPADSKHPDYPALLERWQMCNDFVQGVVVVKKAGEKYLPRPNADDRSFEANARYKNYLKRAVFYEYSSKTINQYLGLAFKQDPICEIDAQLEYLKKNANGLGVSLYQMAQKGFKALMTNGRFGIWADYPVVNEQNINQKLQRQLQAKPKLIFYDAKDIINWRTDGNKITLVVLREIVSKPNPDDMFTINQTEQYRELGVDSVGYYVRVWQKNEGAFTNNGKKYPINSKQKYWTHIPFLVFGSQYNTFDVQDIPIEPLVHIEQGIYCNSADAENSRFLCGQIQPFMNVDNQTADRYSRTNANGEVVNLLRLGSEAIIMLGENGSFGFAQASPNTMATEGIKEKREIIAELGYQLGQASSAIKTATQADNEATAQHSQASLCVANLNEGFHQLLLWCNDYMGINKEPKFVIRQNFSPTSIDVNVLNILSQLIDSGKLPKSVLWNKAREFNLLDGELSDDDVAGMIEADEPNYETLDKP